MPPVGVQVIVPNFAGLLALTEAGIGCHDSPKQFAGSNSLPWNSLPRNPTWRAVATPPGYALWAACGPPLAVQFPILPRLHQAMVKPQKLEAVRTLPGAPSPPGVLTFLALNGK